MDIEMISNRKKCPRTFDHSLYPKHGFSYPSSFGNHQYAALQHRLYPKSQDTEWQGLQCTHASSAKVKPPVERVEASTEEKILKQTETLVKKLEKCISASTILGLGLEELEQTLKAAETRLSSMQESEKTNVSTPAPATLVVQGCLVVKSVQGQVLCIGCQTDGSFGIGTSYVGR
jgi:hypothetical protein